VRLPWVPPGSGTPLHFHASPEVFRVVSGELEFSTLDGGGRPRRVHAAAGDVVSVPSGTPHGYANGGGAPAVVLAVFDGTMERFFRAAGAPACGGRAPAGPPSAEEVARVMAAARAHGIRILDRAPTPASPAPIAVGVA
jgi:gentisate 1,2-dioxygenase